jgi:hypothetical protein
MNTRRILLIACVACAPSACGGRQLLLGEGPDDAGGGAGGATTSTGSSGGTINPGSGGAAGSSQLDIIDDMEDGDEFLPVPPRDGRDGRWTTYNDGTPGAIQWPPAQGFFAMSDIVPPRGSSKRAAWTHGAGFSAMPSGGWATMELSFKGAAPSDGGDAGLLTANYDASAYSGITFYARIGPSAQQTIVRVNLTTPETLPQGGTCIVCYDSFGEDLSLTTEWQQYVLAFVDLQQRGFGDQVKSGFDAHHVYTVTVGFAGATPFDLWIDDIAFYK